MIVRPATSADLRYIDSLRRHEQERVGFLPLSRYERETESQRGTLLVGVEGGDRVGFIFWTPGWPIARIQQLAIQDDARRMERGTALVQAVADRIPHHNGLTCRCREDIEGREFWRALGFAEIRREPGGRRKIPLIRFYRELWPGLFDLQPSIPVSAALLGQRQGFRFHPRSERRKGVGPRCE